MTTIAFTRALARFMTAPYAEVRGATVGEALAAALASRSTLREQLLDERGMLRRHFNIHVNDRPVSDRIGLSDAVGPRDEIYVFPALAGG